MNSDHRDRGWAESACNHHQQCWPLQWIQNPICSSLELKNRRYFSFKRGYQHLNQQKSSNRHISSPPVYWIIFTPVSLDGVGGGNPVWVMCLPAYVWIQISQYSETETKKQQNVKKIMADCVPLKFSIYTEAGTCLSGFGHRMFLE